VALYARVSSDRQDVDLSVAAPLRALRNYAAQHGYVVAREYVDEAKSERVADRPQFRQMIDVGSRPNAPFQEILVWTFSRFTRTREHAAAADVEMLTEDGSKLPSLFASVIGGSRHSAMPELRESAAEFHPGGLPLPPPANLRPAHRQSPQGQQQVLRGVRIGG